MFGKKSNVDVCQFVRAQRLLSSVDRDSEWLVLKARTEVPSLAICALCHLFCSCSRRKDVDQMVPATQDLVSCHIGLMHSVQ